MPLSHSIIEALAEELFTTIKKYLPDANFERLREAYVFAKNAHAGQLRKSGEPYITHPLRTAQILTKLRIDEDALITALLHDVPEDTSVTLTDIEKKFGQKIAYLVDGITKLAKVQYRQHTSGNFRQIASLKKLFLHGAEDLRVILIKLADRLDNMRTLRFIADEKKRKRISNETLEIYVPIANLLGLGELRLELEDLCFEYLYPIDYEKIRHQIEENKEERTFLLNEIMRLIKKELIKEGIGAEITCRQKSLYSIYQKLQTKQNICTLDNIVAIVVIAATRKDCYAALSVIHQLFKPKTGCMKDYIAVPKPNGYQSIHTTVFDANNNIVEFQIRDRHMHLEAIYGVAAHYFYKYTDEGELASIMQQRSNWVQRILELQKEQPDSQHFIENLKLDVFQDRIFVFSPKGDVIDLPRDSSAIDFAYAIHTDIGNHAAKAEINGIPSPITAALSNGDSVRIITDKHKKPEQEWLSFAKTTFAANKIKEQLEHDTPSSNKPNSLFRKIINYIKRFME